MWSRRTLSFVRVGVDGALAAVSLLAGVPLLPGVVVEHATKLDSAIMPIRDVSRR
jgi:hypothetical protein